MKKSIKYSSVIAAALFATAPVISSVAPINNTVEASTTAAGDSQENPIKITYKVGQIEGEKPTLKMIVPYKKGINSNLIIPVYLYENGKLVDGIYYAGSWGSAGLSSSKYGSNITFTYPGDYTPGGYGVVPDINLNSLNSLTDHQAKIFKPNTWYEVNGKALQTTKDLLFKTSRITDAFLNTKTAFKIPSPKNGSNVTLKNSDILTPVDNNNHLSDPNEGPKPGNSATNAIKLGVNVDISKFKAGFDSSSIDKYITVYGNGKDLGKADDLTYNLLGNTTEDDKLIEGQEYTINNVHIGQLNPNTYYSWTDANGTNRTAKTDAEGYLLKSEDGSSNIQYSVRFIATKDGGKLVGSDSKTSSDNPTQNNKSGDTNQSNLDNNGNSSTTINGTGSSNTGNDSTGTDNNGQTSNNSIADQTTEDDSTKGNTDTSSTARKPSATKSYYGTVVHKSYAYNKKGKVIKKNGKHVVYKKGSKLKLMNKGKFVTIKGKKFYQVSKKRYVKVVNITTAATKVNVKATVKGKKNAKIRTYTSNGKRTKKYVYGKKTYKLNGKKDIKGKTYYKIYGKMDSSK